MNEIQAVKEYEKSAVKDLKRQEIALDKRFAKTLVKPFRPDIFHDEHQEKVKQLIESTGQGPRRAEDRKEQAVGSGDRSGGRAKEEHRECSAGERKRQKTKENR